jgi:hypothetical protein
LNVQIQTLNGTPVNNVTISPQTSCLNTLQITQLVEQYCVGCTVIVIPPPAPVIYVPVPGTNTVETTTVQLQPLAGPPPVKIMAYCTPKPVKLPDGKMGNLIYLPVGEPQHNPIYGKAIPATFVPGVGMKCPTTIGNTVALKVPVFTLTVPAAFVGQFVRLCLQPAAPHAKVLCHSIRIDLGATISVPVTSNVTASVLKSKSNKKLKPKTLSQVASSFSATLQTKNTTKKGTRK